MFKQHINIKALLLVIAGTWPSTCLIASESPYDMLEKADQLININKPAYAEVYVQQAIFADPSNPKIHYKSGALYLRMKNYKNALESFGNVFITGGDAKLKKRITAELIPFLTDQQEIRLRTKLLFLDFAAKHGIYDDYDKSANTFIKDGQKWAGYYTCSQGRTLLELRIAKSVRNDVDAIFDFNFQNGKATGQFYLHGKYIPEKNQLDLSPGKWINNPNNYTAVGMKGNILPDLSVYVGTIASKGCKDFLVRLEK